MILILELCHHAEVQTFHCLPCWHAKQPRATRDLMRFKASLFRTGGAERCCITRRYGKKTGTTWNNRNRRIDSAMVHQSRALVLNQTKPMQAPQLDWLIHPLTTFRFILSSILTSVPSVPFFRSFVDPHSTHASPWAQKSRLVPTALGHASTNMDRVFPNRCFEEVKGWWRVHETGFGV